MRRRERTSAGAGRGRAAGRFGVVASLLPVLLVGACAAGPEAGRADPEPPSPFADCAALAAPPAQADAAPTQADAAPTQADAAPTQAAPAGPLPDVRLTCFTGGETVALAALRGPAVVNLWASWCQPCRTELPAFQRLAERTVGRMHVIGVDTRDGREAARSLAVDLGLSFPNLVDRDELLRTGLGRAALPITVLVDGQGRIRHLHDSGALDDAALDELVRRHLGVATGP